MIDRILIGVDFSPPSLDAARWACAFLRSGGEAILAHVREGGAPPAFLEALTAGGGGREHEDGLQARLDAVAGELSCTTSTRLLDGQPATALADAADRSDAAIVAIGPRGTRASRLGTTAEQLVRASDRPVLVVRDAPDGPPRRVLIAIDESPVAAVALKWGERVSSYFKVPATVLHALRPELLAGLKAARPGSPEREAARAATDATERWLHEQVSAAGLDGADLVAPFGSPVHEIVSRTEADGHELVVMGSQGAGAVQRQLFGSVASQVLRAAWCPVMVV